MRGRSPRGCAYSGQPCRPIRSARLTVETDRSSGPLSPTSDSARHWHDLDRHVVTAVLVTHDGARWLPGTLKALLTQTRPVQRLVAADTGSTDRGPAVMAEVIGSGNLVTLPRTTGYGEAVSEALRGRTRPERGCGRDARGSGAIPDLSM